MGPCINQIYMNIAYPSPTHATIDLTNGQNLPACTPRFVTTKGTSQNLWPVSRQIPLLAAMLESYHELTNSSCLHLTCH
jgi:hypothetical protein